MKILTQIGLTAVFLVTFNLALPAFAQTSGEFSCRSRAKEVAAETYKTCMTDQRQTQLEQIRKDYKEKLSELKLHYDNELKKISAGGASSLASPANALSQVPSRNEPIRSEKVKPELKKSARSTTRPSGARSLPPKKGPVKSQSIDLSIPDASENTTFEGQSNEPLQAETRLKVDQDSSNDMELVELPIQE